MDNHSGNINKQGIEEDVISLTQLWAVIIERKKMIIAFVLVSIALASLYVFFKKPVYESRAVIAVGQLPGYGRNQPSNTELEPAALFVQRIKEKYKVGDETEGVRQYPFLSSVEIDKKAGPNIVTFIAQGNDPKEAHDYLNNIVSQEMTYHTRLFQEAKDAKVGLINSLKGQMERIDSEISLYSKQVRNIESQDGAVASILLMEQTQLKARRDGIQRQIAEIEISMTEVHSRPTRILREPTLALAPKKPRQWYIAAGGAFGLFLGLITAIFHSSMIKRRTAHPQINSVAH